LNSSILFLNNPQTSKFDSLDPHFYYSLGTLLSTFIYILVLSIPRTVGVAIPIKATFFITYIMVDGWAGVAGEIFRLKPLVIFHLKNFFFVKTEKDREEAMDPGQIDFYATEPRIQLYFLLGLVYAPVTPVLLPFIIFFFGFAYLVFRHQVKTKETNSLLLSNNKVTFGFYADHKCVQSEV